MQHLYTYILKLSPFRYSYNIMNKRQVLPYNLILTYIQMTTLATFFLFLPNLGGGNKGHLIADSPPPT